MRIRLFIGNLDAAQQAAWEQVAASANGWLELDHHKPALQLAEAGGLDHADLLAFVAPEVAPDSACIWLNHARGWMAKHAEVALCGARMTAPRYERLGWELLYPSLLRSDLAASHAQTQAAPYPVQHVTRGVMLARATVFAELGGFAPELGGSFLADIDLCRRLVAHARAQAGDQAMPVWLLSAPEVACADVDRPPADEAIFEAQAESFARRQTAQRLPDAEAWFATQGALGETLAAAAQVAEAAADSLEKARQEMFAPIDFTFRSRAPLVGPLIATFRQLWFSVAAQWALRAYRQQQARVNAQHAEAIQTLAVSLSQIIATVNQKQAVEAEQREKQIRQTANQLNQLLLDGA